MLSREEIQAALHASRVVRVPVRMPHGPFGLEQLAEAVSQLTAQRPSRIQAVQRPLTLPVETWLKLDTLARELARRSSKAVTPSDVATSLVIQGIEAAQPQ